MSAVRKFVGSDDEKEKPGTNGHRAENQKRSGKKSYPRRTPKATIPDAVGLPVQWPSDQPGRRSLRDAWMNAAYDAMCADELAFRLLWPIFDGIHIKRFLHATVSNAELAKRTGRSESVVKRGLSKLRRAGWITIEVTRRAGPDGKITASRRIGLAFPEGRQGKSKGACGAPQGAAHAPQGAPHAPQGAPHAPQGAQQDPYNPEEQNPEKKPLYQDPEKEPPSGGHSPNSDSEDSSSTSSLYGGYEEEDISWRLDQHPIRESEIQRFMANGAKRDIALRCLAKAWIKRHVLDDGFDNSSEELDEAYRRMNKRTKDDLRRRLRDSIVDDNY